MSDKGSIIPVPDADSKPFWDGCKNRELMVRRCAKCHTFRIPPGPGCPNCGSMDSDWIKIRGEGVVYSYIIVPFASHPSLEDKVPYNVIVVSLPEAGGIHMVSNLVECRNEDIVIGMPVEVVYEDIAEGMTLPKFRPARKGT